MNYSKASQLEDTRESFAMKAFAMNLGLRLENFENQQNEALRVTQIFLDTLKQRSHAFPNVQIYGIDNRLLGPVLFVWDHPLVTRAKQFEIVKIIYEMWFGILDSSNLKVPLIASICYGKVICWEYDNAGKNTYTGPAIAIAVRVGEATIEDNNLTQARIILTDDTASMLLFNEEPVSILKNTSDLKDYSLQLRLPAINRAT